jgi:hypothetical protein
MYAKLNNGVIEKYPYTIGELRKDNPNTSFPAQISQATLAEYGVVTVVVTGQPDYNKITQKCVEGVPSFQNNQWQQTWIVTDASAEEIEQRTNDKANEVRAERDQRLTESDWTQLDDSPVTNSKKLEWATYRQALRDVPQQVDFPWDVVWPEQP